MSRPCDLGERMKRYEGVSSTALMRRTPVILRIDGKAFHTFTRGLDKPYDQPLQLAMALTTRHLVANIQGAVFGYTQSDEISILLQDWKTLETDCWFGYNVQKMVSIASSMATAQFNLLYDHPVRSKDVALFDARAFNLPFAEVANYFVWRQQDAVRNSINSLGQAHFSHKELHGLNTSKVQDKLMLEKGINWNDVPTKFKRGTAVITRPGFKPDVDEEMPVITQDRAYVERYIDGWVR